MKPTEKQLKKALDYLREDNPLVLRDDNGTRIPSTYSGYIASFGGSVVRSGLLGTALLFCNEGKLDVDPKTPNRTKLAYALFWLLQEGESTPPGNPAANAGKHQLLNFLKDEERWDYNDPLKNRHIINTTMQYAVALKLAIRSYKLDDSIKEEN